MNVSDPAPAWQHYANACTVRYRNVHLVPLISCAVRHDYHHRMYAPRSRFVGMTWKANSRLCITSYSTSISFGLLAMLLRD